MVGRTFTGALVGAVVLFVVGFVWYGVSPIGSSPWKELPNEAAFVSAIKDGSVPSGTYVYPYMKRDGNPVSMEQWQGLHASGPLFEVRVHADGVAVPDPGMMGKGFLHFLASALIVAFLLRMALPVLGTFGRRAMFVATLGLFVGVFAQMSGPIWMYYPWDRAMLDVVYNILSWTLAGLAMAALIKPAAAAVAADGTLRVERREKVAA